MLVAADAAVTTVDAALRGLHDAEERLHEVIAATDRIVWETAWQARAVSLYRREAALWQTDLRSLAGQLAAHEHELLAIRATARAAAALAGHG